MSLQSKDQIPNKNTPQKTNPLLKIRDSVLIEHKEKENKSFPLQEKKTLITLSNNSTIKETNSTRSILNSRDLEIFNNLANKLISSKPYAKKSIKGQKIMPLNENPKCHIDIKNIEIDIYNKINNFSSKLISERYIKKSSDGLAKEGSTINNNLNSKCLSSKRSRNNNNNNYYTPNRNENTIRINNKSFSEIKEKKNFYLNNSKYNFMSNNLNIKNNSLINLNDIKNIINNNKNKNNKLQYNFLNQRINSSMNYSPFNTTKRIKSNLNRSESYQLNRDYSDFSIKSQTQKDYSSVNNKLQKISHICPENYENCDISVSAEEIQNVFPNKEFVVKDNNKVLNRSIILKSKNSIASDAGEMIQLEVEKNTKDYKAIEISSKPLKENVFGAERGGAFEDIKKCFIDNNQKANENQGEKYKSDFDYDNNNNTYRKNNLFQDNVSERKQNKNANERKKEKTKFRNSIDKSYDQSSLSNKILSKNLKFRLEYV